MNKDQSEILEKLGIEQLKKMQLEAIETISTSSELILLSPTGSGKTLAFLLPLLQFLDKDLEEVQALILVPSRELATQIEQVCRQMGTGFKVNAIYGGRSVSKDKLELQHRPALLIGTPGRVADHFDRQTFETKHIHSLVLDEFDKSLEVGFEKQMKAIIDAIPKLERKVLTSATDRGEIPGFVRMRDPKTLNYSDSGPSRLVIKQLLVPPKEKLRFLIKLLNATQPGRGIVFFNLKDNLINVSQWLQEQKISHTCFFGGMDQRDREEALIKFRNGTDRILLGSDLAARGIDVPELDFIIHYELPYKEEEFTHRNGRTARMHSEGVSYLISEKGENLPLFIKGEERFEITTHPKPIETQWDTLFITGGRKDKISKGDIAGLFMKIGQLNADQIGYIELKHDCAYVAVNRAKAHKVAEQLNNSRLKKKKVRISVLDKSPF